MKVVALAVVASAFAGPALAADLSAPPAGDPIYAPAPMAMVGHLELGLGFIKADGYSEGYGIFSGAGRVNVPLHNDWNIQVDLNAAATFESDGYSSTSVLPAAHVWHRGPGGAIGVFGGVALGGGTVGLVGVEGTYDVAPNATLGASAAYGAGTYGFNYWTVRGWANYYFTPDTKLRGDVIYSSSNDNANVWGVMAKLEHRVTGTAFSAFGQVAYSNASYSGSSIGSWSGLVGLRLFLDQPGTTLQAHDHMVPWDAAGVQAVRAR
jgi:hypothetical protein